MNIVRIILALASGSLIGYAFGLVQNVARLRHEKKQLEGKLNNGWSIVPGSGLRVACFVVTLALIQVICPMLFEDGTQWWVSGGVGMGYGFILLQQLLRLRRETVR
jgi:hypothetical protein